MNWHIGLLNAVLALLVFLFIVWLVFALTRKGVRAVGHGIKAVGDRRRVAHALQKTETEKRRKLTEERRYEDAIASCERAWLRHGHEIKEKFSRESFEEFRDRFLRKESPIDIVELRAGELREMIAAHVPRVDPPIDGTGERQDARAELLGFYELHPLLRGVYPRELLESYIRLELGDFVPPEKCWAAAHKLIRRLGRLAAEEEGRVRNEEQDANGRRREIDRDIADLDRRIDQMRRSPMDRDINEGEIAALQQERRRLERERGSL